ncbi:hypothetical protein KXJ72_17995 (plasmid) [Comamonas aquatica]|nr:hypothetical protein KXJ72_17995 [Comamonas aquatica]
MSMQSPKIEELLRDPAVSNWLKKAITECLERDPVDAANDAELLAQVLDEHATSCLNEQS